MHDRAALERMRLWSVRAARAGASVLLLAQGLGCGGSNSGGGGSPMDDGGMPGKEDSGSATDTGHGGPVPDGGLTDAAPPSGGWINDTSNLANMSSECGSLTGVFTKPDEDLLIAGIALDGLWGSRNGGMSWEALGSGAGSAMITNRPNAIVYDPMNSKRFWEAGIYNAGGVFETTDDGQTFVQLGDAHHCDTVSVDFTDPNRSTLLAGAHEQPQTLYLSTNGGMTWSNVGAGLPAGSACTEALVIDAMTFLVGCDGGGPNGIFRSTNGGSTWMQVSSSGGGTAPLVASDGSIYWISANGSGMTRSTDKGMTWTDVVGSGVFAGTQGHITNVKPVELPDGRIAALGSQYVVISADHGMNWSPATGQVPLGDSEDLHGVAYSAQRKAFYVWHNSCGSAPVPVASDAVMSFPFDYTKQ